ncbi:RNA polymerase sigma factor [Chitinophaga agri]|nr:sigma-70 family RNA polymerase sigma factor [Chitinophaga agri]
MQSLSDSELVHLLSGGDHAAVEEIYIRYAPLLLKHAFKMLQDEHAAEDVVHDIFSNLLADEKKLEIKSSLDSYLYRAVRNGVLMLFRKSKNQQKYIEGLSSFSEYAETTTDDLILEKELRRQIEDAVAGMPTKMREAWELSRNQHLSRREIAAITQTTEGTVNTQLNRAMKVLKSKLTILFSLF